MKMPIVTRASRFLLAFACLLGGTQYIWGQGQVKERSIEFTPYLWSEPEGRVVTTPDRVVANGGMQVGDYIPVEMGFIGKDGQLNEFNMAARSFSQPQKYKGPSPLVFAIKQSGHTVDAPAYRPVGQVVLPEDVDEAILFFFPRGDVATGHYDISLLPSGAKDIAAGQALIVNLSSNPIAVKLGEQQVALQPQGMQKVAISGLVEGRLPMAMGAQENGGRWRLRLERDIAIVDNSALLLIFYQDNRVYRIENIRLRRE